MRKIPTGKYNVSFELEAENALNEWKSPLSEVHFDLQTLVNSGHPQRVLLQVAGKWVDVIARFKGMEE